MYPEVERIEAGGAIISLQDYQSESWPTVSKESFQPKAVEKIAGDPKGFYGGQKEKCVSSEVAAQITHFCEESPEFAEVVYKTKRTLSDCCAEVLKGTGNHVSDIDVYRGIVKAYFPNADVRFFMSIEINGAAPSEEEMAKVPEKPAQKVKPAPKAEPKPTAAAETPAPQKPAQPEVIQLSLF